MREYVANTFSLMLLVSTAFHAAVIFCYDGLLFEHSSYAMSASSGLSLELIPGPAPGQPNAEISAVKSVPETPAMNAVPAPEPKKAAETKKLAIKKTEKAKPRQSEPLIRENTFSEPIESQSKQLGESSQLNAVDSNSGSNVLRATRGIPGGSGEGGGLPDSPAMPDYLKNPAPAYPRESRKSGEEGVVLLSVQIGRGGEVISLNLKKTSQFPRLDQAALEAVRKWKFKPARLAGIPLESTVDVPVRFVLR